MTEKVDFTGIQSTMLVTLYLRAVESRSKNSILGDNIAAEIVDRIDYDFAGQVPRGGRGNRFMVALRAKRLDQWADAFLRRHPEAVVLNLGCGLDSRAFRLDVPEGVRWFDVDLPDVIGVRRRLYAEPDGYHMVGSSVTDPGWLDEIPAEGPALVIAEGLLMYLSGNDIEQLLHRIAARVGTGELLFDGFAPGVVRSTQRMSKLLARKGYPAYSTAFRDGREVEEWNAQFSYVEDTPLVSMFAAVPVRGYRLALRMMNAFPATRNFYRVFRFEF